MHEYVCMSHGRIPLEQYNSIIFIMEYHFSISVLEFHLANVKVLAKCNSISLP